MFESFVKFSIKRVTICFRLLTFRFQYRKSKWNEKDERNTHIHMVNELHKQSLLLFTIIIDLLRFLVENTVCCINEINESNERNTVYFIRYTRRTYKFTNIQKKTRLFTFIIY